MKRKLRIILVIGVIAFVSLFAFLSQKEEVKATYSTIDVNTETITLDSQVDDFTYYDLTVQKDIQDQIDAYKKSDTYTLKNPLVILNPYGTNTTSLYIYFEEEAKGSLSYKVKVDGYEDYENTLYQDSASTTHEYQIIGLIPDVNNEVVLTYKNEAGKTIKKVAFNVTPPTFKSGFASSIEKTSYSTSALSDGLYYLFGLNYTYSGYSYLVDNDGVVRSEIVLEDDMSENVMFDGEDMIFSINYSRMARVNRLGKVTQIYDFDNYEIHHDYVLNEEGKALILATNNDKESVEDIILLLDLESGGYQELVDFDDILGEYKSLTSNFSEDSTWGSWGDTSWDWLHFNSITLVGDDEMILSSRETSTIMKLSNIYDNITIDYFIGDESIWEDTAYASYSLNKVGDFNDQAGQHSVTYMESDDLEEGQYYLYMYNNNYDCYESRIGYTQNMEGASKSFSDDNSSSYYYCYLVDENKGTYTLVDEIDVPYSSIVSSVQNIDNNILINSGMQTTFYEYDENHKKIASFYYNDEEQSLLLGYRVFKYDFVGYWFQD